MSGSPGNGTRDTVRFLLDGDVVELKNVDPTRTVLQFLREDVRKTGTKEGCAEGDCGACTVALVELDRSDSRLQVRAVNSCIQFLATLDGRELITVEGLRSSDGSLHPVQQAMVDCHGSQCGFCTPGFVMSLFAHYKSSSDFSRRVVDDELAGNLCRCTGYRPIVMAAEKMFELADGRSDDRYDDWLRQADTARREPTACEKQRVSALQSLQDKKSLRTEKSTRRFCAPRSVAELATLLEETPDATILAGGTDIGLWVTKQHRVLQTVVYTGKVEELKSVVEGEGHIDIGAAVSLTDAMPVLDKHFPQLSDLFTRFASPPIRNAGTLGGNVANGSPIGDSMPALLVLNAELTLRKGTQQRVVPLNEFYLAYQKNALSAGEFVERIRIPLVDDTAQIRSYKISKRFDQDISAVCGAYRLQLSGQKVAEIRIAYGGVAAIPIRALLTEELLAGAAWSENAVAAAMQSLQQDFQPISDMRATADYRLKVCQNLLYRFWLETTDPSIETDVYGYGR